MSNLGCRYVVSTSKRWNKKDKKFDDVPTHCGKLTAEGLEVCPKHHVIQADEEKKEERRLEKQRLDREWKEEQMSVLASSPLAAINPKFSEDNRRTGYEK